MKIKNMYFSEGGKAVNEDVAYSTTNYGWVIDGATGLTDKKLTDGESDAQYFSKEWSIFLKNNVEDYSRTLKEIVEDGIGTIERLFMERFKIDFDSIETIAVPSAGIVLVRINESHLEYLVLGDCIMLIRDIEGNISSIYDDSLSKLDKKALLELKNNMIMYNYSFAKARKSINDTLKKHRLMKNTEGGYWILSFNKEALNHCLYGHIDISNCNDILIATDGFMAICDTYNDISQSELMDNIKANKVIAIYNRIREIEEEDSSCERFTRFKKGDDVSCASFSFQ